MAKASGHISQPAISKGVRDFELQVGCRLLDRTPKGVRPTREGAALARHAETLFAAERAAGHGIDRSTTVDFTFEGVPYTGYRGDTVASALVANGKIDCAPSMYRRRPRGLYSAGGGPLS